MSTETSKGKKKQTKADGNREAGQKSLSGFYFAKEKESGGGSFFKVHVNNKLYGTVWARNRYDLYKFLEGACGNDKEFTIAQLV